MTRGVAIREHPAITTVQASMRLASALLIVLSSAACGATPATRTHVVEASIGAPSCPAAASSPRAPPSQPKPSDPLAEMPGCRALSGTRAPAITVPSAAKYCASFEKTSFEKVGTQLLASYKPQQRPSKVIVDHACSPIGGDAKHLVFERGNGHGGSLVIHRIDRDGAELQITRLSIGAYCRGASAGCGSVQVERARVPAAAIDAHTHLVHAALTATVKEFGLFELGGAGGGSGGGSSNDYHLRVRWEDGAGVFDRTFTGYAGTEQAVELPMKMASEPLEQALKTAAFTPAGLSESDRAFFDLELTRTFSGTPAWWVAERYLLMAKDAGTRAIVPVLARVAAGTTTGAGEERRRVAAVEAIATITKFDARVGTGGGERSIEAAAKTYEACLR